MTAFDMTDVFEVPTSGHPYYTPTVDRLAGEQMDHQGGPVRLLPPYQAVWLNPSGKAVHLFAPTRALEHLRKQGYRLTDSIAPPVERPTAHRASRGSDVERFIRAARDEQLADGAVVKGEGYWALDNLLNAYRDHADTGTPLDGTVEGPHPEEDGPVRRPTRFAVLVGEATAFGATFAATSQDAWRAGYFPVWIDTADPATVADMLSPDHLQTHVRDVVGIGDRLIVVNPDGYTDDVTQDVIAVAQALGVPVTFWTVGDNFGPRRHECGSC